MGLTEDVTNLKKDLEDIKEKEEKKKAKKWRLPFKAKVNKKKAQANWIGIIKINENGGLEPTKQQIKEQTVIVDDVPRLATPNYIFRWYQGRKQFPVMFLPTWSVKPLEKKDFPLDIEEHQKKSMEDGSNIKGYKLLMNAMKLHQIEGKKRDFGWLKWVGGAILLGVIAYAFMSGRAG